MPFEERESRKETGPQNRKRNSFNLMQPQATTWTTNCSCQGFSPAETISVTATANSDISRLVRTTSFALRSPSMRRRLLSITASQKIGSEPAEGQIPARLQRCLLASFTHTRKH